MSEEEVNTVQEPVTEETPAAEKKTNSGSSFYKNKIEELEKTNTQMLARLEDQQTQQLQEKENYKELWENEKEKRTMAEEKSVRISRDYLAGLKMNAIEQEALKAGIFPEALADLRSDEITMVEVETGDKGSVNILGAKEYVEHLRENKKYMFKNTNAPVVNSTNPSDLGTPKDLTAQDLVKMQKEDPGKYSQEMEKRFKFK